MERYLHLPLFTACHGEEEHGVVEKQKCLRHESGPHKRERIES